MSGRPQPAMCSADELRALFLFEKLTDAQLAWLCREGRVEVFPAGPVYAEGDPATCFYVLLSGTLVMSRNVGGDDVETNRTSAPGVYAGAFSAYLGDRVPQIYNTSVRVTEPSRFFVLDADKFAGMINAWFPMAVHLLEGAFLGVANTQRVVGQRERLLALGSLSAAQRQTFVLYADAELSYRQVADALGISIGTVMSRLYYARQKLRAFLNERTMS